MFKNKKISLVIPCYNEEEGIGKMFEDMPSFIDEVIIANNGSTDNTAKVAESYNALIINEKNKGYGYACKAGISKATGDIIVLLDGDNSYPLLEIEKILSYMEDKDYDFIGGCRFPLIYKNAQPFINTFANYFISFIIRILFKLNIKDSQSGMMVFKKDIFNKIQIGSVDMGFSQEVKVKTFLLLGIKCGEVHISYLSRQGKSKFRKIDALGNLFAAVFLFLQLKREVKYLF